MTPLLKIILFTFYISVCTFSAFAQPKDPEKMWLAAREVKTDTGKLKALVNVAHALYDVGRGEAVDSVIAECRQLFSRAEHTDAHVEFYRLLSDKYGYAGDGTKRMLYADSMIIISKKAGYSLGEGKGNLAKAIGYSLNAAADSAMIFYRNAVNIFQKLGEKALLAHTFKGMGNVLTQAQKNSQERQMYLQAAEILINEGKKVDAGLVYGNIVRTFMSDNLPDSAELYNTKAREMSADAPPGHPLHFFVFMNEADIKSIMGDFVAALSAADKAQEIAEMQGAPAMLGGVYSVKANIYRTNKNFEKALEYDMKSLKLNETAANFAQVSDNYYSISKDYYALGRYKDAYDYRILYQSINDSLFTANSASEMNEMNVKYKTLEKEKTISDQSLAITNKNNRLRTLLLSIGALVLAIILLAIIFVQRKKTYNQSVITLKKEQDISLLKALVSGEEKERTRLAKELHDGLGGLLAAARMQASNQALEGTDEAAKNKDKTVSLLEKASEESRRIAHNLLPVTLMRFGLNEALKEFCQSIKDSKLLNLSYEYVGNGERIEQNAALSIYRIVQELINNIIKHAGATEGLVQLQQSADNLCITIEDNGKGFAPTNDSGKGIGLSTIASRISYLNGSMDVKAERESGTSVFIQIKLLKANA